MARFRGRELSPWRDVMCDMLCILGEAAVRGLIDCIILKSLTKHVSRIEQCSIVKKLHGTFKSPLPHFLRPVTRWNWFYETESHETSCAVSHGLQIALNQYFVMYMYIWGRDFESHCGQEFVVCNSRFSLLPVRVSPCKWNQPWHTPSQYPVLDNDSLEKIWLPSPVIYNGSF